MSQYHGTVSLPDHLPVPGSPVRGAFQIEQNHRGVLELWIGRTKTANKEWHTQMLD
jgi:hypothetical protein